MELPSVSGSQNYRELCVAAKKEERRLAELKKKQQYLRSDRSSSSSDSFTKGLQQKVSALRSLEVIGINTNHLVSNNL